MTKLLDAGRRMGVALVWLALVDLAGSATAPGNGEPHRFLRASGFSANQIQALERGEPLARVLDTDKREVAVVGAIRIKGSPAALFDRARDIAGLRKSAMVLEVGTFSAAPRTDDLVGLSLEEYDLQTIRECRPGDCGVRLSADTMARFGREVDWRAADWRQQAGSLWRRLLVEDAARYLATGQLGDYHNKETPLSVAAEFGILLDASRDFEAAAPGFFGYLRGFPTVPLAGSESILYWSKENFGVRPVLSLTHLTLYNHTFAGTGLRGIISRRQIYATHYFDAGLSLTMAFDDGASGFYMLCVNRARTRSLTGLMRMPVRSVVQRRCREAVEELLRSTKTAIEKG